MIIRNQFKTVNQVITTVMSLHLLVHVKWVMIKQSAHSPLKEGIC